MQTAIRDFFLADATAVINSEANTAIMAMTVSSSTSVNAAARNETVNPPLTPTAVELSPRSDDLTSPPPTKGGEGRLPAATAAAQAGGEGHSHTKSLLSPAPLALN